jgi:hypothetical protein
MLRRAIKRAGGQGPDGTRKECCFGTCVAAMAEPSWSVLAVQSFFHHCSTSSMRLGGPC